jgi:hypothetical protein
MCADLSVLTARTYHQYIFHLLMEEILYKCSLVSMIYILSCVYIYIYIYINIYIYICLLMNGGDFVQMFVGNYDVC